MKLNFKAKADSRFNVIAYITAVISYSLNSTFLHEVGNGSFCAHAHASRLALTEAASWQEVSTLVEGVESSKHRYDNYEAATSGVMCRGGLIVMRLATSS